jgi:serine/threonine-protein kinase
MKNCPTCHANYPKDYTHCPRDLTALVEIGLWQEGSLVRGRYRILGRIGAGGMATVFKAEHVHFHELRALKAINPELAADIKFVQRFTQEAVLTRRLQHPNAVRVDDIDQAEDGLPFIVMEYIQGRSLKDVLQSEGPMTTERACSIAKQVASALAAAHELGIVHRDIKPANIALVPQGSPADPTGPPGTPQARRVELGPPEQVKVLDFGIAKVKEGHLQDTRVAQGTLTGTGILIGTPAYMSPEQAMGKRGDEIDGRSDLYSLGVMMYQMLTGELPLKADSEMAILIAHIQGTPCDLREYRPDVPDAIANLVMRCLEKKPDQRPGSGKAVIEEIEWWKKALTGDQAARSRAEEQRRTRARGDEERATQVQVERERPAPEQAAEPRAPGAALPEPVALSPEPDQARIRTASGSLPASAQPARPPMDSPSSAPPARARKALWTGVALGIVALGIGVWFFSANSSGLKSSAQGPNSGRVDSTAGAQPEGQPPASQAAEHGNPGQAPSSQVSSSTSAAPEPQASLRSAARTSEAESQARTAEVERQVKASTTEGDVDYDDGLYDDAIRAYRAGLRADPENAQLKARIKRAQKAKETEAALGSH